MREIKFRGKRVDNGEWVYGYYAEITAPSLGLMIRTDSDETFAEDTKPYIIEVKVRQHPYFSNAEPYCIVENEYYEVIPETVGQYTGLKDKNGKEIFEGDIVNHGYENDYGEFYDHYKVIYSNTNTCFVLESIYSCNPIKRLTKNNVKSQHTEVIGNIYDNFELLKESQKLSTWR